jgi:hypothetical protein
LRLFPVGYYLWVPGDRRGRKSVAKPAA